MADESTLPQTLNSNKKPNKLRSTRFPKLSFLKKTSSKCSKSKFSCCLSINPTSDNSSPEKLSPVRMPDISPNYMKITTSYDAKTGSNSQRAIGSVDEISVDSSEFVTPKKDEKIKNRIKNFGSTRSFKRRSRSATTIKNHHPQNPSSVEFSDSSSPPHYRKSTGCSEGKNCSHSSLHNSCESSFDSSDQSRSPQKNSQNLSRTTSMRSVKILINKASFKSKRGTSKCCQIPDKATCSSTIKNSKFKEHVEFQPGKTESMSKFKVCSYHHCSLHGGHYDDPSPSVKRVYRRKRLLKSQKSIRAKREFTVHENAVLENTQLSSSVDPSVCGTEDAGVFEVNEANEYADLAEIDFGKKQSSGAENDGFCKVNEATEYAGLAEIAFGETSFPEQSYKETLNIMSKYSAQDEGTSLFAASTCCNCVARGPSESVSITDDQRRRQNLNSKDDSVPTSGKDESNSRELSKDGSFTNSTRPVFDLFNGANFSNVTSGKDESNNRELSKDGPFTITTKPVLDIFYGAKCSDEISSISARNIQMKLGDMQDKDGKSDPKEDLDSTSGQVEDSESKNCPPLEVAEPKKKYLSMWSLIRRHMVPDASAESENNPAGGANDEENQQDGANKSPSVESSDSPSDFSERETIPTNEDAECQEIELRKLFTIKLVREAIEKILLPEVQSDNQSVTSESSADQEPFEMNQIQDSKNEEADAGSKSKTPNTEEISGSEKETARKEVKNNSEKRAPKHWSNLKKWILLQRFVKALEKVRKINPRKPRYLQLNPDPEAEKVNLRTQTADDRKKGEEWMLDYALQQAISQLAPTQQRKVELLIKAFETVVPPQGNNSQAAFPKLRASSEDHFQITSKENEVMSTAGNPGHKAEKVIAGTEVTSTSNDEVLVEGKARKEDQDDISNDSRKEMSSSTSSLTDAVHGAQERDMKVSSVPVCGATENVTKSVDEKVQEAEDVGSVVRDRKLELENHDGDKNSVTMEAMQENVAREEMAKECERTPKRGRGFSLLLSMSDPKEDDGASKSQVDKRSYITMWHMISQHVLSDVASKVGNEILDGTDDEVEDSNTPAAMKSETKDDADTRREDHNQGHHGRSFCREDAVKLIREAVNEILTTPIQDDSSDTQSVTSDIIPDQELSEAEGEAKSSSNSTESLTNLDTGEGGRTLDQETKGPEAKKKPETQKSKNWSKLKKLILLKRSIKALEKARKFNPRTPQLLPLTPDQEPEKVDLRHQMTDEKKKAEKWMLDYAMQNIVTTLTPARKKRVAMLVEAFEAVVPLPEV
ncbi:calmodulin binding protein PICBP-like isoform X1 [Lycium barbarum]|uniref:calmodulin binding protein PICBP-like isoform X1 n=1 Tax=Lycium barbarum TaxID=112863 RepID=UPI00293F6582|nr:calmodulin binding protein PICBP-like isoform X1 [Lycium barbarum]